MINANKIRTAWAGMVGFQPSLDPAKASWIDAPNQASLSGLYVNSNEYCKPEYIRSTMDFASASDAVFNDYLRRVLADSAVRVVNAVFNEKDYVCRSVLYERASNKQDITTQQAGIYGFRISPSDSAKVSMIISRVFLEFQGTGTLKIMLFHTSKSATIFTKTINISSAQQEESLDWVLDNTDVYGGEYYLAYIANPLLSPYKRNYDNANISSFVKDINIEPLFVAGHATETLPNLLLLNGVSDYIGVNPDITVVEDWTDLAINNKRLFAKALMYQAQINFIHAYKANMRINSNERNVDSRVLANMVQEVEGQDAEGLIKITGLKTRLSGEIKSIQSELKKLNENYFGNGLYVTSAH